MGSIDEERRMLRDRIEALCWECRAQDEGVRVDGVWRHGRAQVECPASRLRDELAAMDLASGAAPAPR